jgi:hypothetical protein
VIDVLVWILGISLALILACAGWVWWLRRHAIQTVRQSAGQLETFNRRLGEIAAFLQELTTVSADPYGAPLDALQEEAVAVQNKIQNFYQDSQEFESELVQETLSQPKELLNAPVIWFRRWSRANRLRTESVAIAARLAEAEERMQRIYEIPWELAVQCRQAEKDFTELAGIIQELQAKNVRGAEIQAMADQVPPLRRTLEEIPQEFFRLSKEALLAVFNVDTVIHVHQLYQRVRQGVDSSLPKAREWRTVYQKAAAEFSELKRTGAELRQSLQHSTEGLEITSLQGRLDQIAQRAADLGQRLALPEAKDLGTIAREVAQLRRTVQDAEVQFEKNNQQALQLRQVLNDLHIGLEDLTSQFEELSRRDTYPFAADESKKKLEQLRQRLQAFGPARQSRSPEQIVRQLKEAGQIETEYQSYLEVVPRIVEQYHALVALLESTEVHDGAAWLRKVRDALQKAAIYHPMNWPKQDAFQTLPGELEEQRQLQERLAPEDPAQVIPETGLAQRLEDTRRLAERYKTLRPRVDRVMKRLEELRSFEKEGKEILAEAYAALDRVGLLAESNDLLAEVAAAEVEQVSEEIRVLSNELNTPGQGEIEKKLQKSRALAEKVNRTLLNWLACLNSAIVGLGKQIQERLAQVDAIIALDDGVVIDARSVLSRNEYQSSVREDRDWNANGKPSGAGQPSAVASLLGSSAKTATQQALALSNLDVTAKIKRRNDLWQTLTAVEQALDEKTAALLTAQEEVLQIRDEALSGLTEIAVHIPGRRAWPPNNQTPLDETGLLKPIDRQRGILRKQSLRVEQAVLELGRLAQQYQLAAERIRQVLERAERDVEQVERLEEQIEGMLQRWQDQALSDPNNAALEDGVNQLIRQTRSSLESIQQKYLRGVFSYEEVVRSIQLLCDKLSTTRIAVDAQNEIGLSEQRPQQKRRGTA